MGTFTYPIEVISADGNRSETVDVLVNTGSTYTCLPATLLGQLGIVPNRRIQSELANGSFVEDDIGTARVSVAGIERPTIVVFADENTPPNSVCTPWKARCWWLTRCASGWRQPTRCGMALTKSFNPRGRLVSFPCCCHPRTLLTAILLALLVCAIPGSVQAAGSLKQPQPLVPGESFAPSNLAAVPGLNPGEVDLTWTASPKAETHWVWSVKADGSGGKWTPVQAGSATVGDLDTWRVYSFVVIASRRLPDGSTQWSALSNWAKSAPKPQHLVHAKDFLSVSAGDGHTCGVRTDRTLSCWGDNGDGRAEPPNGEFQSVSAGAWHTCAIRTDGGVACWGDDNQGQASPPPGAFRSVSVGDFHSCGVRTDGGVTCWGSNRAQNDDFIGQATPPEGEFLTVSAGALHTCGLKTDHSVACWGSNYYVEDRFAGQATPPEGRFLSIDADHYQTCGIRTDHSAVCWGMGWGQTLVAKPGKFQSVSAGDYLACGVRYDGSLECWGEPTAAWNMPLNETFQSVSVGFQYTCGVSTDNRVICWGLNSAARATPPSGPFQSVHPGAGVGYNCAVKTDLSVICWGLIDNSEEAKRVLDGPFLTVTVGGPHACGIRPDRSLDCWGADQDWDGNVVGQATPPAGTFRSTSSGSYHTCGVRTDGDVTCWGSNESIITTCEDIEVSPTETRRDCTYSDHWAGQATPPEGKFRSVSAGAYHTCGIKADGGVICWGSNKDAHGNFAGQAAPPEGSFLSIGAGMQHTCGVRSDGALACWGSNQTHNNEVVGQSTPPLGEFLLVTSGQNHNCAVTAEGTVSCWGYGFHVPEVITEPFRSIGSGGEHTCVIRMDDGISCWGPGGAYVIPAR